MHTYGLELLFFLSWWRQKSAVVVLQSYSSSSPRAFFRFSALLTCASKGRERDAFVVDTSQDIFFFPFFLFSIEDTCQPTSKVRKSQIFLITKVVLFFLRNCTRQSVCKSPKSVLLQFRYFFTILNFAPIKKEKLDFLKVFRHYAMYYIDFQSYKTCSALIIVVAFAKLLLSFLPLQLQENIK